LCGVWLEQRVIALARIEDGGLGVRIIN